MKLTRSRLRSLIIEAIGDGKLDSKEAAKLKALFDEAVSIAYDTLYTHLEDHKGGESTYTFEQLKEIVNDERDYDEEPIPDAAINAAIDRHAWDEGSGVRLIPDGDGWKVAGHWGY